MERKTQFNLWYISLQELAGDLHAPMEPLPLVPLIASHGGNIDVAIAIGTTRGRGPGRAAR